MLVIDMVVAAMLTGGLDVWMEDEVVDIVRECGYLIENMFAATATIVDDHSCNQYVILVGLFGQ